MYPLTLISSLNLPFLVALIEQAALRLTQLSHYSIALRRDRPRP